LFVAPEVEGTDNDREAMKDQNIRRYDETRENIDGRIWKNFPVVPCGRSDAVVPSPFQAWLRHIPYTVTLENKFLLGTIE
jgi:hypothetical protein